MSYYVYRYVDTATDIVKYVGISKDEQSLHNRIVSHRYDDWYKDCKWRIEYIEVNNRSVAEAMESHLIALYETDSWYNVAKANWGLNPYLPNEIDDWIVIQTYNADGKRLYYNPSESETDPTESETEHTETRLHRFSSKDATNEERRIYLWWLKTHGSRCKEFDEPDAFFEWVVNQPGYSTDTYPVRIDDSIEWGPSNVYFANKDSYKRAKLEKLISFNGETHSMTEWANKIGISLSGLSKRLSRGCSIEEALTMPKRT